MKLKNLTLLILASMTLGALVGCGKEPADNSKPTDASGDSAQSSVDEGMPAEYSLMKFWGGNEAEEYYDVEEKADSTVITYTDVTGEDSGGWAYVKRSFAYDAAKVARFGEYKKVTFTGKLTKYSGSDIVMVKVEGDGVSWEKRFTFEATERIYEFGLNFVTDWTKVTQILFFANRSTNISGNGVITLTKFALSKEEVDSRYDIAPGMPKVPQGATMFNGLAGKNTIDVFYHWGYASDGGIATEEVTGGYKFTWGGDLKKGSEYEWVSSHIKNGDANLQTSGLKKIVFNAKGSGGQDVIFKFECLQGTAVETRVTLTGQDQVIEFDVEAIVKKAEGLEWMAMIMPAPGQKGSVPPGELTLTKCYLSTEAFVPSGNDVNFATFNSVLLETPKQKSKNIEMSVKNHVATYTFANLNKNYDNSIHFLAALANDINWAEPKDYNHFHASFKASINLSILVKPYDNNDAQQRVDLIANQETAVDFEIAKDLVDFSKATLLFIHPGFDDLSGAVTGSLVVTDMCMAKEGVYLNNNQFVYASEKVGNYSFSYGPDGIAVNYKRTAPDYDAFYIYVGDSAEGYNTLTFKATSTVITHMIIKPLNNPDNEEKFDLAVGENNIDHSFAVPLNEMFGHIAIILGYGADDALEGTVTLSQIQFSKVS